MSNTVGKRSDAVERMATSTERMRSLMGGTTAMREAGKRLLPKFEAESETAYDARLKSSWLFNGYRKTVNDMAGRVFDKPVVLEADNADALMWSENIDMQGNDLSRFALQVFKDGLAGPGVSYIMVEAPMRPEGELTRGQAQAMGLRPYFVHLRVEDILGWRTTTIDNRVVLSQLRLMEEIEEPDPADEFEYKTVKQVRVLDRLENGVQVRIYRQSEGSDSAWTLWDEPTFTGLPEITVVPFYANRCAFFEGEPVLDDLADVNIAHWQSQSDQRHILHVARVPILHAAGRNEDEGQITIGANQAVKSMDPNAKLEWVEHSGQAIGAGRQDLKDLEFQMETHGLQLLVAKPNAQSATGEALDAKKETSQLAMIADGLKDALENAFMYAFEYAGIDGGDFTVSVNTDFGLSMLTAQEVQTMLMAVNTGNMTRDTFLREMKRRGFLSPDADVEDEVERLGSQIDLDDGAE